MTEEQKQFNYTIRNSIFTIPDLLQEVENEIIISGYGNGWHLKSLIMVEQGKYNIVVERQIP